MSRYRLYGLVVDSEVDLHQDRPTADAADVTVRLGSRMTCVQGRPDGHVLLHYETAERRLFTATTDGAGYRLRFYGTADFVVDSGLSGVVIHAVDGVPQDTLGVLVSGTLLSFLLALRGEPVLHASAVDVGGTAVAFVGSSGMGKSTMATLLCAAGAQLITDDVLRVDLSRPRPRCYLGATALRLRKSAEDLAELFPVAPNHRVTGDGRDSLTMTPATEELLPLGALVIPVPQHGGESSRPELVRLDRKHGLLALLQFPRLVGWEDAEILGRQLQDLGAIVEAVPVYVARLPWGPPFAPSLAGDVIESLGLETPGAGTATRVSTDA